MPSGEHNLFIASLPEESRTLLLSHCVRSQLPSQTVLYECEERPKYLFFLQSGMASVVTTTSEGMAVEVGLIGREGFSASLHLLGSGLVSTRCFMQTDGSALRIDLGTFKALFETDAEIRARTLEFVQNQMLTLSQLAACNGLHSVDQRLARMLLMLLDRSDFNMLALTQELMSEALGTRRTTVTVAASQLQKSGIIEYRRGHLRVLDRGRLKDASCTCYPIVQQLYLKIYEHACLHHERGSNLVPAMRSILVSKFLDGLPSIRKEQFYALNIIQQPTHHLPVVPVRTFVATN